MVKNDYVYQMKYRHVFLVVGFSFCCSCGKVRKMMCMRSPAKNKKTADIRMPVKMCVVTDERLLSTKAKNWTIDRFNSKWMY